MLGDGVFTLHFHPEADRKELVGAAEEYRAIWDADGDRLVEALTQISGLDFKGGFLHALVHAGDTTTFPLLFKADLTRPLKQAALSRHLARRLLADHGLDGPKKQERAEFASHANVNLILLDAWHQVWGEAFARDAIAAESQAAPVLRRAWQLVLTLGPRGRQRQLLALTRPRRQPLPRPKLQVSLKLQR
ncbi:MAG TPA: hypothetical protein VFD01_18160 [Candidatus Dormibacteraeota bacterium]|nr:hypothetical protein [Candidatus Dormibacteraeota bacterium]